MRIENILKSKVFAYALLLSLSIGMIQFFHLFVFHYFEENMEPTLTIIDLWITIIMVTTFIVFFKLGITFYLDRLDELITSVLLGSYIGGALGWGIPDLFISSAEFSYYIIRNIVIPPNFLLTIIFAFLGLILSYFKTVNTSEETTQ